MLRWRPNRCARNRMEVKDNEKIVAWWFNKKDDELDDFNPNATVICQATWAGFGTKFNISTLEHYRLSDITVRVGFAQVCLCEGLAAAVVIAIFATLHVNRQYISKVRN